MSDKGEKSLVNGEDGISIQLNESSKAEESLETRNEESVSDEDINSCLRCCFLKRFDGNAEAGALAINNISQGLFIIGGIFISTAILNLSFIVGNCVPGEQCKIIGLKASSLLTTITSVASFISAFLLPIVGAIVDHSDYRKQVAIVSGVLIIICNFFEIFVSANTFWFVIFCYSLAGVIFLLHQMTVFAYFNELTDDSKVLTRYQARFHVIRQMTMFFILTSTLIISISWPGIERGSLEFNLFSARVAQVIIFVLSSISMFFSFYKGLKPRSALSQIPENSNILTVGFKKLVSTLKRIFKTLPAVKWFLISTAFVGSTLGSLLPISVTYMSFYLKYGTIEIGFVAMLYLLLSLPGAGTLTCFVAKFGILGNMKFVLFMFMIAWASVGICIPSPEYGQVFFAIACFWGFFAGMIIPNGRTLYLQIIPKGQEAEMMGLYIFFTYGFVWIPPLVLTFMNEAGVSLRYSISLISLFVLCSLAAVSMIGNIDAAKEKAQEYSSRNSQSG